MSSRQPAASARVLRVLPARSAKRRGPPCSHQTMPRPGLSEPEWQLPPFSLRLTPRRDFSVDPKPSLGHGVAGPTSDALPNVRPASSPTRGHATTGVREAAQRHPNRSRTPAARDEPGLHRCHVAPGSPSPRPVRDRHRSRREAHRASTRNRASATEWPGPRQTRCPTYAPRRPRRAAMRQRAFEKQRSDIRIEVAHPRLGTSRGYIDATWPRALRTRVAAAAVFFASYSAT